MTIIRIKDILYFAPNIGVVVEKGALTVSPDDLHQAVTTAFSHMDDKYLRDACHGGSGPLAHIDEITYDEYIEILKNIENREATSLTKREHTKIRRSVFNSNRSRIVLAMIEAGVLYVCSHPNCEINHDLTIDHVIPISRGGSDDLANLRFLCRTHNSSKGDRFS